VEFGAIREAIEIGDPRQREQATAWAIEALVTRDPSADEAFVTDLPAGMDQKEGLQALFLTLGKTNPERGIAILLARPEFRGEGSQLFYAWTKADPKKAATAALNLPPDLREDFLGSMVFSWALDSPEDALAWMETLPADLRRRTERSYLNGLSNKHPKKALAAMIAHPEWADSSMASRIGNSVANRQEAEALIADLGPGTLRTAVIGGMARQLMDVDPEEAFAWAQTLLPGEKNACIQVVFHEMGGSDPAGAMDFAIKALPTGEADAAIADLAGQWMSKDFEAGFRALTSRLKGDALARALPEAFHPNNMGANKDAGPRLKLVLGLDPDEKIKALEAMGAQWGMVDPQGLREHLAGLSPQDRLPLIEGLLRGVNSRTPGLVAEYAGWLPPDRQLAMASDVVSHLAPADPTAAAAFVLRLPPGASARASAAAKLVKEWVYEDPGAAESFLSSLAPGKEHDRAALDLARQLGTFDPDAATRQLAGMSGETERATLLKDLAKKWKRVDAARGQALLLAAAKSEKERQAVLAAMNQD
jgi:hypothetical protein